MKNDSGRSRLIELQSFLQSKTDVDLIYRVLMFLPCFMHFCMTRCIQVDRLKIFVFFIHRIHKLKDDCQSLSQNSEEIVFVSYFLTVLHCFFWDFLSMSCALWQIFCHKLGPCLAPWCGFFLMT